VQTVDVRVNGQPSSVVVIDWSTEGEIQGINDRGQQLLGYKLKDLKGKKEDILLGQGLFESDKCKAKWSDIRAGKSVKQLLHYNAKDGSDVFLDAQYIPNQEGATGTAKVTLIGWDVSPSEKRLRNAFAMMEKKSIALNEALQEAREAHRMREEMDRALQAMSTPVTPIWEGVLLLPLVGVIDSSRTDEAMKTTLEKISSTGAKMFILDISGVPTVDTAVANQLIKITKATKIMGCETIVSGVSSSIAHTIVELGIDIGEMSTTSNLRDAVSTSIKRVTKAQREKKKNKKMVKTKKSNR
jgi:methyl-accepting chemotaxis protein